MNYQALGSSVGLSLDSGYAPCLKQANDIIDMQSTLCTPTADGSARRMLGNMGPERQKIAHLRGSEVRKTTLQSGPRMRGFASHVRGFKCSLWP